MKPESILGQPAVFRMVDDRELPEGLSVRERRLLVGALNFHALTAPGRTLTVHGYDGGWRDHPRTTDDATFHGMSRMFARRLFTVAVRSLVPVEEREFSAGENRARALASGTTRHIHISPDAVLDQDPPRDVAPDRVRRVMRGIRATTPLLYDEARDIELLRHRRTTASRAPRRRFDEEFAAGPFTLNVAADPVAGAVRAVLIGVHWFELGGAERWAFETIRLVREAGLLPIVLSNRDSHQPWIGRAELDGALVLPFSEPTAQSQTPGTEEVLRALLANFDVRGVVVHHNQWLYDRLHWIRRSRPEIPIMDSTHIVEYRGGGYPRSSALVEEAISTHHVISPSLERWMTQVQGIDATKVVMAPLGGLTVAKSESRVRPRSSDRPFTVAFVGRMARQKAPEVFVEVVSRLEKDRQGMRFIMHGDGELATWVEDIVRKKALQTVIERRDSSVPVASTLDESDLLVVSSHNEGLTLTTLEAIAHGVPVISTDVGGQADVVPRWALVSRNPHRAVSGLARLIRVLHRDEEARGRLWEAERTAERTLLGHTSASEWFSQEVSKW